MDEPLTCDKCGLIHMAEQPNGIFPGLLLSKTQQDVTEEADRERWQKLKWTI